MKFIGWAILLFNYLLTATGEHWQNYVGMLIGVSIIALGYKLERR